MPRAAKDRPQGQIWGPPSSVSYDVDGASDSNLRMQLCADIDALLLERFEQLTQHLNGWMGRQEQVYKSMPSPKPVPVLAGQLHDSMDGHAAAVARSSLGWGERSTLDSMSSAKTVSQTATNNSVSVLREAASPEALMTGRSSKTSRKSSGRVQGRTETIMSIHGGFSPPPKNCSIREPSQKSQDGVAHRLSNHSEQQLGDEIVVTKTFSAQERERRQFASSVGDNNRRIMRASAEAESQQVQALQGNRIHVIRTKLRELTQSSAFDFFFAILIITNAGFIGLQVQYNAANETETTPIEFYMVQCVYTICFFVELVLRVAAEGCHYFCGSESLTWNWFDFVVVALSVIEACIQVVTVGETSDETLRNLSIIRIFRIIRIVRVMRVIRIVRFLRSLRVLIFAIFHTLRSCVWALVLFGMVLYVFGIIFAQATTDHITQYDLSFSPGSSELLIFYGDLPRAIFTLYKSMCGGVSWHEVVMPLSDVGEMYVGFFCIFIAFTYFAMMNVVTGLFCQSAIESAQRDQYDLIQEQIKEKDKYVKNVKALFQVMDSSNDGSITFDEFEIHLNDERMRAFFKTLDIDTSDAWTLFKLLDTDGEGTVDVEEFVDGCMAMRGNAKGIQIAKVMYEIKWMMNNLIDFKNFVNQGFNLTAQHTAEVGDLVQAVISTLEEYKSMQKSNGAKKAANHKEPRSRSAPESNSASDADPQTYVM